jgi:hypothetical protein
MGLRSDCAAGDDFKTSSIRTHPSFLERIAHIPSILS